MSARAEPQRCAETGATGATETRLLDALSEEPHESVAARARRLLFGPPKDVKDPHAFHKLSLVALLAWGLIFEEDTVWTRLLHNETGFIVQSRWQRRGIPMIVVPVRVHLRERRMLQSASSGAAGQ